MFVHGNSKIGSEPIIGLFIFFDRDLKLFMLTIFQA